MDLPSCPQEMLASVLKYTTFETVTRIRKINKQMDYVSVKYRCNLPRLYAVLINCYGTSDARINIIYRKKDLLDNHEHEYAPELHSVSSVNNQYGILNEFQELIEKIGATRRLCLSDGEIDQEILDLLQKPRILKMDLFIRKCNFCVSMEALTAVLAKFKHAELHYAPANEIMNVPIGIIAVDAVRCGLYRVTVSTVGWECPFSLSEVKKSMLRLIECFERKEKKISQWTFGHLQMHSEEEMQKTIDNLLTIPGTRIKSQWKQYANITYNGETPNRYLFEVRLELIDGRF